jgi:glycosyltransferase involved in cell wall biosynthesis
VRIGVNALYLIPKNVGGTEIYLRELLTALAAVDTVNDYYVFTNLETGADLTPKQANFHWRPQTVRARLRPCRILWEQVALPLEAARCRLDVLFNPGYTSPMLSPCASVTVFHDLQHKRHPEYFRWLDLPFWRFLLWASVRRSRTVIAVSEATRKDLHRFYQLPEKSVRVIHHGVDPAFFTQRKVAAKPYLLCVSTLHPHKNFERLISAFACAKSLEKLVIVGMRGFHARQIEDLIAKSGSRDRIELTGWVSRQRLIELYAGARAFVYPSTFEGFGMPVLEALASGIPTACADIPPLREVVSDAALLFDPLDETAMGAALTRIWSDEDLRVLLASAGPERARQFTWEHCANETLAALVGA